MLKFKYTKASGVVSERYALIVREPERNTLMLDLTELSESDRFEVEQTWLAYQKELEALQEKYIGFKRYFKTFNPAGISDREVV